MPLVWSAARDFALLLLISKWTACAGPFVVQQGGHALDVQPCLRFATSVENRFRRSLHELGMSPKSRRELRLDTMQNFRNEILELRLEAARNAGRSIDADDD